MESMDSGDVASHVQTPPPTKKRGQAKQGLQGQGVSFAAVNTPSTIKMANFNKAGGNVSTSMSNQEHNWLKSNLDAAYVEPTMFDPNFMPFSPSNSIMDYSTSPAVDLGVSSPQWMTGQMAYEMARQQEDRHAQSSHLSPNQLGDLSPTSKYSLPPKGLMSVGPFSSPIKPTDGGPARPATMSAASFGQEYGNFQPSMPLSFVDPSLLTADSGRPQLRISSIPPKPTGQGEVIMYEQQIRDYEREQAVKQRMRRQQAVASRRSSRGSDTGKRGRPQIHRSLTDSKVTKRGYTRRSSGVSERASVNNLRRSVASASGDLRAITSGIAGMSAPGYSSPTTQSIQSTDTLTVHPAILDSRRKELSLKIDDRGRAYTVTTYHDHESATPQSAAMLEDDTESEEETLAAPSVKALQPSLMPPFRAEHEIEQILTRPAENVTVPSSSQQAPFTTAADTATFTSSFDPGSTYPTSAFPPQQGPYPGNSACTAQTQPQPQQSSLAQVFSYGETTSCICSNPVAFGLMIKCAHCHTWSHSGCVGVDQAHAPAYFVCGVCQMNA